jgi:predicted nucleotidyltransferase
MDPIVEAIRGALQGYKNVRFAILFGSHARGTARADSDVDLAVAGSDVDSLALAGDLSRTIGREVDVLELERTGYPLLNAIVRDGVVVHEAERGSYARWRSHALATLDTDQVWFERMRDAYLLRLADRRAP